MTVGIQIINDYGTVLIDENYSNICVRQKGTVTIGSSGYVSTFKVANCSTPMVALKGSGLMGASTWFDADGTTLNIYISGGAGVVVTWYLFDVPVSPSNYGLVIYKADGSVAFDAAKQYARIVDIVTGTDFPTTPFTKSYPSGRSYALVRMKAGYYRLVHSTPDPEAPENGNTGGWIVATDQKTTTSTWSGNTLSVTTTTTSSSIPGPKGIYQEANNSPSWVIAVVDVTGY